MTTITVEITGPAAEKLRLLVDVQHRSEAEIVGDALAAYTPIRRALPTGVGKYRSGHTDTAQNVKEILRQAVEDGEWP